MALLRDVIMSKAQPRANHDLSRRNRFTASPGIAYPVLCVPTIPGDQFHLKHMASVETYPMLAPLKGSFKLQISYFFVPHRLYTQSMDINRLEFDPATVKFPSFNFPIYGVAATAGSGGGLQYSVTAKTRPLYQGTLLDYLGYGSTWGNLATYQNPDAGTVNAIRFSSGAALPRFDATPLIGYYDIIRNYFVNTQEGYVYFSGLVRNTVSGSDRPAVIASGAQLSSFGFKISRLSLNALDNFLQYFVQHEGADFNVAWYNTMTDSAVSSVIGANPVSPIYAPSALSSNQSSWVDSYGNFVWNSSTTSNIGYTAWMFDGGGQDWTGATAFNGVGRYYDMSLSDFRNFGLIFVTHRPDMFTAWLSQGVYNDMVSSSTINVVNNQITMNQIRFDSHLLDYYERGLVSGGRMADWIYSQFGVKTSNRLCIPELLGVSSSALVFNEVTNTSNSESDIPTASGLGGVASKGQGYLNGYRQTFTASEYGYLIGIFTIVPNVSYDQNINPGFFKTQFGDLYAASMARIGFQTLPVPYVNGGNNFVPTQGVGSRPAGTGLTSWVSSPAGVSTVTGQNLNLAIGYQPAWQEMMTAVDEVHSDLASNGRLDFWSIVRRYSPADFNFELGTNSVAASWDLIRFSSYVFPFMYSYAFADQAPSAQNFICEISFDILCRRILGKSVMPTLA